MIARKILDKSRKPRSTIRGEARARYAAILAALLLIIAHPALPASLDLKPGPGLQLDAAGILPVGQAFRLTASRHGPVVQLFWQIAPGHYLYRARTSVPGFDQLEMPAGLPKRDEYFGDVEVFYEALEVNVPLKVAKSQENGLFELEVHYQGCSEAGICYPMVKKIIKFR